MVKNGKKNCEKWWKMARKEANPIPAKDFFPNEPICPLFLGLVSRRLVSSPTKAAAGTLRGQARLRLRFDLNQLKNVEECWRSTRSKWDRNDSKRSKVKDLPRDPSKISAWSVPPSEAVFPSLWWPPTWDGHETEASSPWSLRSPWMFEMFESRSCPISE